MTQLAQHPAYLQIEDRLDVVGQKYRVHRMIRGAVLFVTTLLAVSWVAAGLVSVFSRDGHVAGGTVYTIAGAWLATVLAAAVAWVVRPVLLRPQAIEVARLIESRMTGLHNGLTNAILLAERDDVAANPWSESIVGEIAAATGDKPLGSVVRLGDLKTLAGRCGLILLPMLVVFAIVPRAFTHGFRQMLHPSAFVPKVGAAEIVRIEPGAATRIAGHPVEFLLTAKAPENSTAKIVFSPHLPPGAMQPLHAGAERNAAPSEPDLRKYAYRLDHLDETLRYRVEVAGTQSDWYTLTVVRQIKLTDLQLTIASPPYTKQERRTVTVKPDAQNDTPITVPQGSTVIFTLGVDVPVAGAMLQSNSPDAQPVAMKALGEGGKRFNQSLMVLEDTAFSILLTDSSGTVAATLPASPLNIAVTKDAAPRVEMKWPTVDTVVAPDAEVKLSAVLLDDYGVASSRVLYAAGAEAPLAPVEAKSYSPVTGRRTVELPLKIDPAFRKHGQSVRVRIEATDNRDLTAYARELGPQTGRSTVIEIKFRDKEISAARRQEQIDKLRQILQAMLKKQQDLHGRTVAMKDDRAVAKRVQQGQTELRDHMTATADTFAFDESNQVIKRTLQVLVLNPAKDAIDLAGAFQTEPIAAARVKLSGDLQSRQRRIISALESLLAMLNPSAEPATQPAAKRAGDLPNKKDEYAKLNDALKKYLEEQRKILDQSAQLAKKPVDDFSDKDKKLLEELAMGQEKLDAFLQEKIADFSKLAEQDMSNASLLKELMEVYSEVTMAKDALKKQAVEIAVPIEDMGMEMAKVIQNNLEKWLMDEPDRIKWQQEDPGAKSDVPMAELPKELEDMIGELLEEQEDLFEEMEDANANWTDSMDKGAGWDAADGPIANMSAKGVTGNQLPNNNEMGGRAGEGRSGKSQGEFVEETATGKGGRNTPTRLDPTAFQQGQIKDQSKDPVGGATGGGKISGQGGQGLEGPVPPKLQQEMKRLAQKQAELRNKAERLNLQYQLGRYDNFNLLRGTALMRRVESDLNANRYHNALRRRDVLLDSLDTSQLLLGGRVHVQQDTSPTVSQKTQQDINDAMKGDLPPAWSEALKQYYQKLGQR